MMVTNLFQIAGLGIVGWALLIFLPTWRPTRALADSAFFPTFIAILYAGVCADSGWEEGGWRVRGRGGTSPTRD
jgi:hypothetical protein